MAKIGQLLLNKGRYGNMEFMREETFEKLLPTDLSAVMPSPSTRFYGFGSNDYDGEGFGKGTFAHGAASSATFRIDPVNNLVLVMTRDTAGTNFEKYHSRFLETVIAALED